MYTFLFAPRKLYDYQVNIARANTKRQKFNTYMYEVRSKEKANFDFSWAVYIWLCIFCVCYN